MIEVFALADRRDIEEAVEIQRVVWGFQDVELIPVRFFVVATKVGGQVFGAFDGRRMVGFCLAIPGLKPGGVAYLHSHMLGVLPEYHNRGIGRMLKLKQRDDALERGISLVEWTFDPLEIKNAWFNIERLGAIVRRYVENQYGTTSSPLHGSLPTDRCIAEWWISSARVQSVLCGRPAPLEIEERIEVPLSIDRLRRDQPREARVIQQSIGDQFRECFARNLAVLGFETSENFGTYLLGPCDAGRTGIPACPEQP